MTEEVVPRPDRRRRRPALACTACRRSKIRCDRNIPCNNCLRSRYKKCAYEAHDDPLRPHQSDVPLDKVDLDQPQLAESSFNANAEAHTAAQGSAHGRVPAAYDGEGSATSESGLSWRRQSPDHTVSLTTASPQSHTSTFDAHSLLKRIRHLENRLEQFEGARAAVHDSWLSLEGRPPQHYQSRPTADDKYYEGAAMHIMARSVMNKNRYFGQSHWANGVLLCRSTLEIFEQQIQEKESEMVSVIHQLKSLGRAIKIYRTPKLSFDFGANIPPKEVADKLVAAYFGSLETVYRILHAPSFKKDYDHYWASSGSAEPGFIIQLQLVMAIGSAIYDEMFSMRKSAVQWVYEAQTWLIAPKFKSKFNFISLQNTALLCLARQTTSLGGDLVWVTMGSVLRSAIYAGLHRDLDRLPGMTQLRAELRRRLWGTILELALQSSMDAGGPPMISLNEYETRIPANCDDEHLVDAGGNVTSQSAGKFTDMSVALIFRESFPIRLAVVKFLNSMQSKGTYKETIRLHTQLSAAYKSLSRSLQALTSADRAPSLFQKRILDLIFSRYFMALHVPFLAPAFTEPAYAFSRKTVVEMSLKAYCCARPQAALVRLPHPPPPADAPSAPTPDSSMPPRAGVDAFARFSTTGGGFFRYIPHQASVLIALELQNQLQEDVAFGLPTARPDLLNVLHDAKDWSLQRVRTGETNAKGYLLTVALAAQIDGMLQGMQKDACEKHILASSLEAGRRCLEVVKQLAGEITTEPNSIATDQLGMDAVGDAEEWDAMQGVFFDFTNIDSVLGLDMGSEQGLGPPWR